MSGDAEMLAELAALPPAEVLLDRYRRRQEARESFLERADRWAAERGGRVRFPADRAAIVALGVPCEVCDAVVTEEGQGGHLVAFGLASGEPFGASIVARCEPYEPPPWW